MRILFWILTCLLALQLGCASISDRPQTVRELLQSEENLTTVRSPDTVEVIALSIAGDVNPYRKFDTQLFTAPEHVHLRSAPVALPAELKSALSKKLVTNDSYYWEGVKGCAPFFHVRATFTRRQNVIIADFCFDCELVYFRHGDKILSSGDFMPARAELLSLFRKVIPNNHILEQQAAQDKEHKSKPSN